LAFAICAACTLWLIAQNTILVSLASPEWVPVALREAAGIAKALATLGVQLLLVPFAFALGWLVSRRPSDHASHREAAHE
jgi:hypothetical protein